MKKLKKIIVGSIAVLSLSFVIPVGANAEWRKNGEHWQYYRNGKIIKNTDTTIDSKVYFFNNSGNMQTGWINKNNFWYYCYSNGEMAQNTSIDGYILNVVGVWIPGITEEEVENYKNRILNNVNFSYLAEDLKINKKIGASDIKFLMIKQNINCENLPGFNIENGIYFNINYTDGQPVTAVFDKSTNKIYTFNWEDTSWGNLIQWDNKKDIKHLS